LEAEKAGIPAVVIAATSFLPLVHELCTTEGVPAPRVAEYPSTFSVDSEAKIRENFEKVTFNQIVEALTKPVKKSGGRQEFASKTSLEQIEGTYEEINEFFYKRSLTDGLPITPPTIEKVEEFLKYTAWSPHEKVAQLQPGNLIATPSIIAANGVMAGCRPEHMPILIAAVEAIADPNYDLEHIGTTGGVNPFLIINGPIIKQLGIEHGVGLISRGPNPAIGRALGLIIRNIAGFRPGEQRMGTFGYILPFVLAEDEDGSPWEPFHRGRGFARNTSTVTAGGTKNWGGQVYPSGTDPEGLLKIICTKIAKRVDLSAQVFFGKFTMCTVVMNPSVAQGIAQGGYSKKDAEQYLFENSRVTIGEINFELKYGNVGGGFETMSNLRKKFASTIVNEWCDLEDQPNATVPAMGFPNLIRIVICGDPTRNKAMVLYTTYNNPTTKEIKLPANWDKLMRQLGYPPFQG
jgi:hypothetical protein